MYRFVPATDAHIKPLIDNINNEVAKELKILMSGSLATDIQKCIKNSDEAWTAFDDDMVICMFGIGKISMLSDVGHPWLITTNLVYKYKRDFLKGAKVSLEYWLKKYGVLENYIPAGLDSLLKWVKWAGFIVSPAQDYGLNKPPLHKIEMRL